MIFLLRTRTKSWPRPPSEHVCRRKRPRRRPKRRSASSGRRRLRPSLPRRPRLRTASTRTGRRLLLRTKKISRTAGMRTPTRRLLLRLGKSFPRDPRLARTTLLTKKTTPKMNRPRTNKQPKPSKPRHNGRRKRQSVARRLTRLPWLPARKMTSDLPSVVFSDTSIPERRNCLTRSDRRTSKKAKPVVSLSRLVPPTSPSRLSDRKLQWLTKTDHSTSRFRVYSLLTRLATSPSLTCALADPPSVTSPSSSLTSCTASSLRRSSR